MGDVAGLMLQVPELLGPEANPGDTTGKDAGRAVQAAVMLRKSVFLP